MVRSPAKTARSRLLIRASSRGIELFIQHESREDPAEPFRSNDSGGGGYLGS